MNVTITGTPHFHRDNLTIVIGDGRRRRNVQENLASRKRDITIVQGAAFRVQKRGNNTYSIEANGTTFEDVVILVWKLVKYNLRILLNCNIPYFQFCANSPCFKNGKFSIAYGSKEYDTARNLDYGFLELFLKSRWKER